MHGRLIVLPVRGNGIDKGLHEKVFKLDKKVKGFDHKSQ